MTRPILKEHDVETGEVIERELNADEMAQFEAEVKAKAERDAVEAKAVKDKAALLDKLGITQEEASLLLS